MNLAVFTPLNPARSGISDYSESLLPEMARHLDLTVFIDDGYQADGFPAGVPIRIRNHREHRPEDFDETLYQFGNNPFHVYVYDAALRNAGRGHPGIILLHEANLHHLVAAATIKRDDWDGYMRELAYDGGPEALIGADRVRRLEVGPDYDAVAMNRRVIEGAKAVIVHSDYMVGEVRRVRPDAVIQRIPHGAWITDVNRNLYRHKLGLDETTPLIGVFGFLKPYKRIQQSLEAMRRLVRVEPRVRMILVGEEHPDLPVRRMAADFGLGEHVRVLGYTPIDDFVQYVGACDICLNLRYPTVGETSGTLLRALGLGRAVIVSDVGAFAGLPDDICLKVPVGPGEVDVLFECLNLLVSSPDARRALGERARLHVSTECSWAAVGERFASFLRDVHEPRASASGTAAAVPLPDGRGSGEPGASASGTVSEPHPSVGDPTPQQAHPPEPRALASGSATSEAAAQPLPHGRGSGDEIAGEILSWVSERPTEAAYVESHLTRLVRTLEITPPARNGDAALEMGAYLHITPALANRLGYRDVRGCYLGPLGKVNRRTITSNAGETFACDIDHFDAERDAYPYPEERFATVLCCELLEHLYEDPMHLMGEINRILRPGGHLVLSTPNVCSLRAIAASLLNYHPGLFHQYVKPDAEGKRDPRHAREYAPRDVQTLFESAGFEVIRLETGPYLERKSLEYQWVRHLLARYELPQDHREDSIFCVGRKTGPVRERYPAALYAGGAG